MQVIWRRESKEAAVAAAVIAHFPKWKVALLDRAFQNVVVSTRLYRAPQRTSAAHSTCIGCTAAQGPPCTKNDGAGRPQLRVSRMVDSVTVMRPGRHKAS